MVFTYLKLLKDVKQLQVTCPCFVDHGTLYIITIISIRHIVFKLIISQFVCHHQVHRRILKDDGRGVGEPLNETGQFGDGLMVRGKHYVTLSPPGKAAKIHRTLAEQFYMAPTLMFAGGDAGVSQVQNSVSLIIFFTLIPCFVRLKCMQSIFFFPNRGCRLFQA